MHEQKAHGLQWAKSMGVATITNQNTLLVTLMGLLDDSKHTKASFSPISTDLLCL